MKCSLAVFANESWNYYRVSELSANHGFRNDIESVRVSLLKKYYKLFGKKDKKFYTCYAREVLSCVLNCMEKYYSNP